MRTRACVCQNIRQVHQVQQDTHTDKKHLHHTFTQTGTDCFLLPLLKSTLHWFICWRLNPYPNHNQYLPNSSLNAKVDSRFALKCQDLFYEDCLSIKGRRVPTTEVCEYMYVRIIQHIHRFRRTHTYKLLSTPFFPWSRLYKCLAVPAVWAWGRVWGIYNSLTDCIMCIHTVINSIWSGSTDHLDVLDPVTPGLNCYLCSVCNIQPPRLQETLVAALYNVLTVSECAGLESTHSPNLAWFHLHCLP